MTDDARLLSKINEELRQAHATNGELREQLIAAQKDLKVQGDSRINLNRLEDARAETERQRHAAEQLAAAAERKLKQSESEIRNQGEEIDNLKSDLALAREQLDAYLAIDEKVAKSSSLLDLHSE
jgi:hypothetical protein